MIMIILFKKISIDFTTDYICKLFYTNLNILIIIIWDLNVKHSIHNITSKLSGSQNSQIIRLTGAGVNILY